jgi:hypothetical protein
MIIMKKKLIATIIVIAIVAFIVCACVASPQKKESVPDDANATLVDPVFKVPETTKVGGYEIQTDTMYCKVIVCDIYKYSYFESYDGNRKVEFYAGPTEMIIVDTSNGQAKYYTETYEDIGQTYTNPLEKIFGELENMDFHYLNTDNTGEIDCHVFESIQTYTFTEPDNIRYNVYSIEMDWTDGEHYSYKYYEYADGSTLISAEAPDEINPRLVGETKWVVDLDNLNVHNIETNEAVSIAIVDIAAGHGLSPDSSDSTIQEKQYCVYAYVNTQTGKIEKLQYSKDKSGTNVNILTKFDVAKPTITDDMVKMDGQTLQLSMMLIYMLESLI